jgi:hypothetical protein
MQNWSYIIITTFASMCEQGCLPSHCTLTSPSVVGFLRLAYLCLTCICFGTWRGNAYCRAHVSRGTSGIKCTFSKDGTWLRLCSLTCVWNGITSHQKSGPGSSVGIATDYGLDDQGIESRWGEIFRPSRLVLGPSQPPVQWVPCLSRG